MVWLNWRLWVFGSESTGFTAECYWEMGELPKETQKEVFLSLRCSCTCDTHQCLFMCLPVYLLACIQCSGCHGGFYTNFANMPSLTCASCAYSPLCLLAMWGPRQLTLLSGDFPEEQRKSPPVRASLLQRWPLVSYHTHTIWQLINSVPESVPSILLHHRFRVLNINIVCLIEVVGIHTQFWVLLWRQR